MDALIGLLANRVRIDLAASEMPAITRQRHRQALLACHQALCRGLTAMSAELIAEDLRMALREIGRVTGRVDVEDLLDIIFCEFCIGK